MEDDTATPFAPTDHLLIECFCCMVVLFFSSTYQVMLYFTWFHPYRSDHQVTFIQLHSLPVMKKNKGRPSTERNATVNLSHDKHHKTIKTSDDIDTNRSSLQSQSSCSWSVPFFSFFSSVLERRVCSLLILRGSILKNSSTKWQSPWRIVQWNRRVILLWQDDVICPSVLINCSDSWIFWVLIWTPVSLP